MDFLSLETQRLSLTEIGMNDVESIYELFSDNAVIRYYDLAAFEQLSEAEDLINFFHSRFIDGCGMRWGIRLKESQQLIGTCGFNTWNIPMKNATIGYDLMPQFWRKGLATEAVTAIIKAAFSGMLSMGKLHRIQADTIPQNIASEALLLKIGFQEEGLRRHSGYWKNQFHDLKCFGLIASEYEEE